MYYWDLNAVLIRKCETDVSVVVRRMYYWDLGKQLDVVGEWVFQQLLEECTIGTAPFYVSHSPIQ